MHFGYMLCKLFSTLDMFLNMKCVVMEKSKLLFFKMMESSILINIRSCCPGIKSVDKLKFFARDWSNTVEMGVISGQNLHSEAPQ